MLCEKCNKNEAKIRLVYVKNKDREGLWLCERCAKEFANKDIFNCLDDCEGFTENNIFNSFLKLVGNSKDKKKTDENKDKLKKCISCGMKYYEFKKSGMLGCEKCYLSFRDELIPLIKKAHFSTKHSGKYPRIHKAEYELNNKVKKLNNEMNEAVLVQNYEKAAFIRDQIIAIKREGNNWNG